MNYPIRHFLKNPNLAGKMVSWSLELLEYDITFTSRNIISSQVLVDFLIELSWLTSEELPE